MKARKLQIILVIAILFVSSYYAYHFYQTSQKTKMSYLEIANIEALANDEASGSTCEASVSCSSNPNDFVKCTGRYSCERKATTFSRWVKCDGIKTSC